MPNLIDLQPWLDAHPTIKKNIKWNATFGGNAYHVEEADKIPYDKWTIQQKKSLSLEYTAVFNLFSANKPLQDDLAYPPQNLDPSLAQDEAFASVRVSKDYAWKLYIKWIAFNLYAEIYGLFPWRLVTYNDSMLQMILDSTSMSLQASDNKYILGVISITSPNYIFPQDNLGASLIAPPFIHL